MAKASLAETHYHLYLSKCLNYIDEVTYQDIEKQIIRIKMMLNKLIQALNRNVANQKTSVKPITLDGVTGGSE